MCTPCTREVVVRYPLDHASKLASVVDSSSDSAREVLTVFSTDPFSDVLQEIMTETLFLGRTSNEACGRSILGPILGQFWSILVNNLVKQVLNSVKQV